MKYLMDNGLYAIKSYVGATQDEKAKICNGVGSENGIGGYFYHVIPNTIYGLNISEAADIHDWEYSKGKTPIDRLSADDNFLSNMRILILNAYKKLHYLQKCLYGGILYTMRRARAYNYYILVRKFGNKPFHSGKKEIA